MVATANNIDVRIERIENLVAKFMIEQASKELLQLTKDFSPENKRNAILLSSQYFQWKKLQAQGTETSENLNILINKCTLGILNLLDEVSFLAVA